MSPALINQLSRGKFVYRCKDEWGDILVMDKGDDRILTFDSIHEQSRLNKKQPALLVHLYTRAMLLGLALIAPRHVTMLGLGSGCLLQAFDKMLTATAISVVEYRTLVVEVAKKYFWLPTSDNIAIAVADAETYLEASATASTDIIFSDLYNAEDMHPLQLQTSFLLDCHRVLTEGGWLVANFHHLPDTTSEFFTTLEKYFEEILIFTIPTENYIIYAGKQRLVADLDSYVSRTGQFPHSDKLHYEKLFRRLVRLTI